MRSTQTLNEQNQALVFTKTVSRWGKHLFVPGDATFTLEQIKERWKRVKFEMLKPSSVYNQHLLVEELPAYGGGFNLSFTNYLPKSSIKTAPAFDLIQELNQKKLNLPQAFFLSENDGLDTAFSEVGLKAFMSCYGNEKNIHGLAFENVENFKKEIPSIKIQSLKKDTAVLVCLNESKRHVTGFYFKVENQQLTVFILDTTGLTLPAEPCGYRYNYLQISSLNPVLKIFQGEGIVISIMPINTILSVQSDSRSCLMATTLFFDALTHHRYQILDTIGIHTCFGQSALHPQKDHHAGSYTYVPYIESFDCIVYTLHDLSFLVGCQSDLAFLFMMDSLKNADQLFPEFVKYRTDWQRSIETTQSKTKIVNAYWQAAYSHLLMWFNKQYLNEEAIYPDFENLACSGNPNRIEESEFEKKVFQITAFINEGKRLPTWELNVRFVSTDLLKAVEEGVEVVSQNLNTLFSAKNKKDNPSLAHTSIVELTKT